MARFTALGEMASTLAHEINQPLTAITNYLKGSRRLLEKSTEENAPMLRDAVEKAAEQALRAGDVIRHLRDFVARGESERQVERLPALIEEASSLALVGAREINVLVSYKLDPAAELVLTDRIQIQQVLLNLMRNAVEAMQGAPRRELKVTTVARDDGMAEVSVIDTGPGLAPEVSAQLFQPFVTTKKHGMGVGLSICRTIVELHGGHIWAEAMPAGGTAFRFTLRIVEKGRGLKWPTMILCMWSTTTWTSANRLAFFWGQPTLPCACTNSATAFLSTATSNLDGCIVTDVRMPGIDGIEFLRQLRTSGHTIPVIVMTGHADVALAVQAMKEGASDFIEKPFDDEMLIDAIRSALANRNQVQCSASAVCGNPRASVDFVGARAAGAGRACVGSAKQDDRL